MKLALTFLTAILLLTACGHRGDAEVRKKLTGTWRVDETHSDGDDFHSMTTVAADGNYVCHVIVRRSGDVILTQAMEGTFQVKDGILIDTMTKHSHTNAHEFLPIIAHARIVRINDRELVLRWEESEKGNAPTNDMVFRREK